jgi:hypothetical protein
LIRDLPIWTKLGLIMIVPTIATIVVGTAGLLDQVEQASAAERARALTVLSGDAGVLVHALQAERGAAVTLLASPSEMMEVATATYSGYQEGASAAASRFVATRTTIADVPTELNGLLDRIQNQLGQLTSLRQQILALNQVSLSVAEDRYEELINDLLGIRTFSAQLTGDTSLADRIRAAAAVALQKEFLAREAVLIGKALVSGEYSTSDRNAYALVTQNARQAETEFRSVATPAQIDLYERTVTGAILRDVLQLEGTLDALRPEQNPAELIDPAEWQRATVGRADLLFEVEAGLNGQALDAAETVGASVQRRVLVETGVLLLTLLIGVLFAWLVARSMARSLRDLRQGALAVAQFGLPQAVARLRDPAVSSTLSPAGVALQIAEPLPVRSNDEFGQVTEAFNAVHLEAVRTAAEQAALRASVATMFVNLARRSQILVDRLIGHLDRLERGEQDPDRLSELFQLDHLATRMRRNDENLLVLAGADSTRIQREPAALMDVLRAAQSEVEQYTRVEFLVVDQDIEIAAHAVNDLVHLVAELFDNATQFSPPDTAIRVEARRIGERAVLRIEDRGIGMPNEQYAELNERLATPPLVDVAVSRMMGLVVVARLGARHGVTVELQPAPHRGTVADVVLPSGVLVPRALAGRTHAPTGFPAVWPGDPASVAAGPRSPFGPPLALESGSAPPGYGAAPAPAYGGPPGYDSPPPYGPPGYDSAPPYGPPGYDRPSPFGAPPFGAPPPYEPTPAPAYGAGAAGAAAAGLGAALTSAGAIPPVGGNGRNGGRVPAWYDLTGASGPTHGPATTPGGMEPLPQRRPGWGESDPEPPPMPRQGGAGGWADPGTGYGGPGYGGYGAPAPSAASVPPPAAHPSTWPPVGGDPRAGVPGPTSSNDMTVELPIFSELESAWFASGSGRDAPRPGAWPPEASTGTGATAGSSVGSSWSSGEDARRSADDVSWRTVADDGWRAAQAAASPQDGGTTDLGLPRRVPMAQLVPGGVESSVGASDRRTPDSVRGLLSAYHRGVQRGREAHGASDDPYSSGKEHEA